MKTSHLWRILLLWLTLVLSGAATADDSEAYTKILDRLTSVSHFSERPVLFIIGFDTTKSMSVEFDRSKRLTQTLLSRYGAPGDSVYIFGFANKPVVLPATSTPKLIPTDGADSVLATLSEGVRGLPRSSEFGTVFDRAKLFALEKAKEFGADKNVVVLLYSDNNSELEMGVDERKKLVAMEKTLAHKAETIPLLSQGVSPLWLTLYANSFPDTTPLTGPDGESDLESPRLAWAARRAGSQVLEFIEPANPRITSFPATVSVQFLGPVQPDMASLTVDGKAAKKATFSDGRASWTLEQLESGSHVLFAQAVLPDKKVRTAELSVTVGPKSGAGTDTGPSPGPKPAMTPSGPGATPTPTPSPKPGPPKKPGSKAPFVIFALLAAVAAGVYLLSTKPARIRVIGPNGEESFLLPRGKSVRIGGTPRVESDLIFTDTALAETIAQVSGTGFGKANVSAASGLREGTVDVETDEGHTALESGEPLLTSATITFTSQRGVKDVFTVVKEDGRPEKLEDGGHFGGDAGSADDDGGDWRS